MSAHYLIVLDAALVDRYNADALASGWGPGNFAVPLYPAGGPYTTPTRYWCEALIDAPTYAALQQRYAADIQSGTCVYYDAATTTPQAVLAALGLALAPSQEGL